MLIVYGDDAVKGAARVKAVRKPSFGARFVSAAAFDGECESDATQVEIMKGTDDAQAARIAAAYEARGVKVGTYKAPKAEETAKTGEPEPKADPADVGRKA